MNALRTPCLILLITLWAAGCGTPKPANPLDGFHMRQPPFALPKDKAIEDDYTAYIQALPLDEKQHVINASIRFLEDSSGQTAVQMRVALHGIWWMHALIYDKDKKRIKSFKYKTGGYQS